MNEINYDLPVNMSKEKLAEYVMNEITLIHNSLMANHEWKAFYHLGYLHREMVEIVRNTP